MVLEWLFWNDRDYSYIHVLEPTFQKQNQYIRIQDGVKKVPTIHKQNHSPTKQLWTIQNPNMFGIQAPIIVVIILRLEILIFHFEPGI